MILRDGDGRPERVGDPDAALAGSFRVETVRDYPALRESDRAAASAWRDAVADALEACMEAGMVVSAFDSGPEAAPAYVLARPEPAGVAAGGRAT